MDYSGKLSYFRKYEERFFFIIGNTTDEFCTNSLEILFFDEILHKHLQDLGYERIIFYTPEKMYFIDPQSKSLTLKPKGKLVSNKNSTSDVSNKKQINKRLAKGPLGHARIKRKKQNNKSNNKDNTSELNQTGNEKLYLDRLTDASALRLLQASIKDSAIKTAVIFSSALDFLTTLDQNAIRQMNNELEKWLSLPHYNENIVIWIFTSSLNRNGIEQLNQHPILRGKMFDENNILRDNVISLGLPKKDEIHNIFQYYRLMENKKIDWSIYNNVLPEICSKVKKDNIKLKTFIRELNEKNNLLSDNLYNLAGRKKEEKTAWERLSNMDGMETVVKSIRRLINMRKQPSDNNKNKNSKLKSNTINRLLPSNKKSSDINLNIALMGNPGTGKTTVARMIGEIFREEGLLEGGHLVETGEDDLVAGYVGQTAIKTRERINEAREGVLFIDEAYSLVKEGGANFGQEAINTIVRAATQYKGQMSFIIAGYPKEIQGFLDTNSGLEGRFATKITIPDYEPEILYIIFNKMINKKKLKLNDDLEEMLPYFFKNWFSSRVPRKWQNAREVENLVRNMDSSRIERIYEEEINETDRLILTEKDIPEELKKYYKKPKIASIEEGLSLVNDLIGLKSVKDWIKGRVYRIQAEQKRGKNKISPGHYIFAGNPGTGKTTVAKRFGEILKLLGIVGRDEVTIVTGADLIKSHVGESASHAKKIFNGAINGVLFIDEAYTLIKNQGGTEVLENALLPFLSEHKEDTCVILAGYPDDIQSLLDSNSGFTSRFQSIVNFEDFNSDELMNIFNSSIKSTGEIILGNLNRDLSSLFNVWTARKDKNFGNARSVKRLIDLMREQRDIRVMSKSNPSEEDLYKFICEDIPQNERDKIGLIPESLDDILNSLNDLVGLKSVKDSVDTMINRIKLERKLGNEKGIAPGHYIFTGNPGTGKTTVARRIGDILRLLGVLKSGHVIEVSREDLVAEYIGQTATKTKGKLQEALDGVLFIDEAYRLTRGEENSDTFGTEAVDTLVAFMENYRDRFCIIAAGYPDDMEQFLQANVGLKSRITSTITFDDYNCEEMLEIFMRMSKNNQLIITNETKEVANKVFKGWDENKPKDFGNARDVRKILDICSNNRSKRLSEMLDNIDNNDSALVTILPEDVPFTEEFNKKLDLDNVLNKMDDLIGLTSVKNKIKTLVNGIKVNQKRGIEVNYGPGHYIFTGNPGTGKTTVARRMGEIFKALGILSSGHVVEVSREDLVAGYVGQTAIKTKEKLEEAIDGVLFIDEAYRLTRGEGSNNGFGIEAVDTLVAYMENHRGRICIIAAGYPNDMNEFLRANAGLNSRFSDVINFEDYTAQEMLEIFIKLVESEKLTLADGAEEKVHNIFKYITENKKYDFANARDVRKVLGTVKANMQNRLVNIIDELEDGDIRLSTIELEDIPDI